MRIRIDISKQTLCVFDDAGQILREYRVSTAANGAGECEGSGCTPRGRHRIRARIGAGQPTGAVFRGRRPTGETWSPELAQRYPERDWILSRILWLSGCEPGRNRLGQVDSMRRYIYIHGTPEDEPMGEPRSHGCVRMRNADVIELFDLIEAGTEVDIVESEAEFEAGFEAESERGTEAVSAAGIEVVVRGWSEAEPLVMPVREAVFVQEQGVPPELERDAFDAASRHAIALAAGGDVVGTGRLLPDGHIGRMAVSRDWRGRGVGGRVLQALIAEAGSRGIAEVVLNAQLTADGFYRAHGFVAEGDIFMEAGIAHRTMRKSLAG